MSDIEMSEVTQLIEDLNLGDINNRLQKYFALEDSLPPVPSIVNPSSENSKNNNEGKAEDGVPSIGMELLLAKTILSQDSHPISSLRDSHLQGKSISAGGKCRLLPCGQDFLAVNLLRESDFDLLPAWLETHTFNGLTQEEEIWNQVSILIKNGDAKKLDQRAGELGLAVGLATDGTNAKTHAEDNSPFIEDVEKSIPQDLTNLKVADISALWAGPLVGKLFSAAGADVLKLEDVKRDDGLKAGRPKFYEYLNGGKQHYQIDFKTELAKHLQGADVVIDNSRSRAMRHLNVDPEEFVAGGAIWISITGYGRASNRAAFGDDAAVAGGLLASKAGYPEFIGDAIADPIAGAEAYFQALSCLSKNKPSLLDISMVEVVRDNTTK